MIRLLTVPVLNQNGNSQANFSCSGVLFMLGSIFPVWARVIPQTTHLLERR
jgi:hypothetical protein